MNQYLKKFVKCQIVVGMIVFLFCGRAFGAILSKDMRSKFENMRMAAEVYDRHGRLIGNLCYHRRIWTPIEKIPIILQHAVIAVEDSRFYQHNGVDLRGMARALVKDLIPGGTLQGGSTITQQLAKIVLLSSERTLERKIQDIAYALEIEKNYSKKEILEFYLNSIYLGHGNVGVEAAARYYFGKSVSEVSLDQMALLAGMIRGPEYYSPLKNPKLARERRNTVLRKMLEQKYITPPQNKRAQRQGLNHVLPSQTASVGAYFLDYVHECLLQEGYSEDELRYGGYDIYTTLDLSMEEKAERSLLEIPQFTAKTQPQAALVTIDPVSGEILAMAGGRDYGKSQLNRAVKSYRQPGSAIKPFVYATALEGNYTAASIFEDKPLSIPLLNGMEWKPENYDRTYRGKMTLREALRESINSVAVQLLQRVGVEAVFEQIQRMGITSLVKQGKNNDQNLASLALGGLTKGVTPLELATAYAAFANQGRLVKPVAILKVVDSHGKVLKEFKPEEPKTVLSPQTAYILTMLLKDAVDQGTGIGAKLPDRPAAGKTGTTSDYTNAWFVGYTPDLLTAIWVGNDRQEQRMTYKEGNVGSSLPAKVWGGYMSRVTAFLPVVDFARPEGIVWVDVDPETGQAVPSWFGGKSYKEIFNENNVPEYQITNAYCL
ncbi:MAG: penicillin-binding protein [Deltaproteobacteria bacterium CG_4_8_14_3_um_filter_45_9]|jgi:penicillin-binding protein 1A|nr:MAG: penicillin-binding protein [Deltaproteobacteria bacterium CG03_land_8_20_14_0_80_45_14]PIX21355.1 MAG: penicillin-binding protein [Deltaproteobacteria bacterium CG_4_8_14_3_um_filter_45_9]